ncbi:efflux RND transporter periplasmic adaptor subunit [Desulfobacter latus]|uniref:Efflux RND transporter periplasmic adaptor subunit n=1 Tax=Desulfobacter latus TaxID=2292 RepID=A0A850T3N2_9BACT|nr:efflux RND transporter periplasmic adaptor subunit [Desulfobacter latus]NWH06363.1 efflux RND transporter periplasmic adaptor subunit [Desulfobacter latus]
MSSHKNNTACSLIAKTVLSALLVLAPYPCRTADADTGYQPQKTVVTKAQTLAQTYPAVGTVRPKSETRISAQISAQITDVHVKAGQIITSGTLLITLDSRQAAARLKSAREALRGAKASRDKARQAIKSAEAAYTNAKQHAARIKSFYASGAATEQEFENAQAGFLQSRAALSMSRESLVAAEAGIQQATETITGAKVHLGFSKIIAPVDGEIIRILVEPGDLALPGKPLAAMRTKGGYRVEAHVREGLINTIKTGSQLQAVIPTPGLSLHAVVEEIIPYADPRTRTFLVKAAIPAKEGLYSGMYAKLMVPEAHRTIITLDKTAIIHAGQLELVMVKMNGTWQRRYITTIPLDDTRVEVLSGLSANETIGIGEAR